MNYILFLITFFFVTILIGMFINSILKISSTLSFTYLTGFITLFASFEIIALPFMLLHGNFSLLVLLYCLFLISILLYTILKIFKTNKGKKINIRKLKITVPWVIFFGLLLIQLAIVFFFAHYDADDSFFIAVTNTTLHTNQIFTIDPSTGLENTTFPLQYSLTGYELLIAFFAKIFMIKPVVLFHTLLPLIFIPTSYIAFYFMSKKIMLSKYIPIFLIFISLLNLFSNYSIYSPGAFLLFRSWQGKGSLVNILLPLLLSFFISIVLENKKRNSHFFLIIITLIASVCFSTVGIYLLPVSYFCLTLGYFIFSKDKTIIAKLIISALPSLFFLLLFLIIGTKDNTISGLTSLNYAYSFKNELTKFFGGNYFILAIYLLSYVHICFKGSKVEKLIFSIYPLILFLTFLNPLFMPFIAKYLTGAPVYWRLFWLIPIYPTIAFSLVKFFYQTKLNLFSKIFISFCFLLPILLPKNFIFNTTNYTFTNNLEKIPQEVIDICDTTISNVTNPVVLSPIDYSSFIRQYSGDVKLVWSRDAAYKNDYLKFNKLNEVYYSLYENNTVVLEKDLELLDINTLVLYPNSINTNLFPIEEDLGHNDFLLYFK